MEPSPAIKALAARWVGEFGIEIASMIAIRTAEKAITNNDKVELKKNKALLETLLTYPDADRQEIQRMISRIEVSLDLPVAAAAAGGRRMTRKYCKKTPCRKMGFTQKASCRPYKNCYRNKK